MCYMFLLPEWKVDEWKVDEREDSGIESKVDPKSFT